MNLNTLISETLRDIENNQIRLSGILGRCLRIANHFKEFDDIMWFTYNLHDLDELSENKEIKKNLYRGLLKKHGKEESKKHWEKSIYDYFRPRRIEQVKVENQIIVEGGVTCMSVASIENKIEALTENQQNNTLPEGLTLVPPTPTFRTLPFTRNP